MGIKKPIIKEQPMASPSSELPGGELTDQGLQAIVGAQGSVEAGRELMGTTPISQGYINRVVLDYLDGTGPFGLSYSFAEDVIEGENKYNANETFTTKNATYNGVSLKGASMYVYGLPVCNECAKAMIQVGIKRIVMPFDGEIPEIWQESCEKAKALCEEAGVQYSMMRMK